VSPRRIRSIFHPSDFSESSEVAFAHALKIALVAGAELNILHVSEAGESQWAHFPGVRQMLERWHVLPPESPQSAVPALGIQVRKVLTQQRDPVAASLAYMERNPTDLVVLATHQHEGRARWLTKSVAQPLARESGLMTLFLPAGREGFVSRADGSVSLRSVLIPTASDPKPGLAIEAACQTAAELERDPVAFALLHVGNSGPLPAIPPEQHDGWTWDRITRQGDVPDTILAVAGERHADLIVMATEGRHGFLDALRGSTTERVLRHSPCPLLAVPGPRSL
jgi:nucleotide-binding universal stress UspA family protein